MSHYDIFDTIQELRAKGQEFCVATVLRTADVTSAKAGAKAAISTEGDILGHLGGACVQRAVRTAATAALDTGQPRMIRVKPADKVVTILDPDGFETFKSGCPSGGTVDLLIEPYRQPPKLVVLGESPIATAVIAHAKLTDLQCSTDPEKLTQLNARDFVVVASQGRNDSAFLAQALGSAAGRVSMVASRRKAAALCAKIAGQGISSAQIERLKAPAGLDIGAIDPHGIALSILAEITLWRAQSTEHSTQEVPDEKLA